MLGNIYVTCLKKKREKNPPKTKQEKKNKGSGNIQPQYNMCSAPNTPVPGAGVDSDKRWEASQPPHRSSRGSSCGFNPDISHPNLQLGRVLFWSCLYICSNVAQSVQLLRPDRPAGAERRMAMASSSQPYPCSTAQAGGPGVCRHLGCSPGRS